MRAGRCTTEETDPLLMLFLPWVPLPPTPAYCTTTSPLGEFVTCRISSRSLESSSRLNPTDIHWTLTNGSGRAGLSPTTPAASPDLPLCRDQHQQPEQEVKKNIQPNQACTTLSSTPLSLRIKFQSFSTWQNGLSESLRSHICIQEWS
ncbi:hypothetical protein ZWY2020_033234 [Hordeum vulgare]|nr:hypothetical protein ZWY2020_033234 [Hordeum vulgare]